MAAFATAFHLTPQYQKGDTSQKLCAAFFMERGWYVIPSYDFTAGESKAPRMQGKQDSFCLPDLDVCKSACRRWVEVKYKRSAAWFRKCRRLQHGISHRLFNHYLTVERESGCELYLAIHEGVTEKVLVRRVSDLPSVAAEDSHLLNPAYQGLVYFRRSDFQYLATVPIPNPEPGIAEVRQLVRDGLVKFQQLPNRDLVPVMDPTWSRERQGLLFHHKNDALTLMADLDLLPWFGEV